MGWKRKDGFCVAATGEDMDNTPPMQGKKYTSGLVLALLMVVLSGETAGATPVAGVLLRAESAHFVYIYQRALEPRLPRLMKHCEDAHDLLTGALKWEPRDKTYVMFFDSEDIHNGWATVYPRPRMMIYAADSPPGSTIYEPGRYLRRTVFHEYAHILQMDAQYGFDAALSAVFGRAGVLSADPISMAIFFMSVPPGAVAPAWYQEGVSVWAETELVGPGRGRDTLVDMIMRMAVAEGRLLPANRWSLYYPDWPYGNAAYLYGMKAVERIHDEYPREGKSSVGDVVDSVAHSFWFNFSRRSRPATGKSFGELAREAMDAERTRQAARIKTLGGLPFTSVRRLTPERFIALSPKFDSSGRHIYLSGGPEEARSCIYRYDIAAGRLKRLGGARTTSERYSDLAMTPARDLLYFTRLDIQGRECVRSELYRLRVGGGHAWRVAGKGRYRSPAVSGNTLAAVSHRGGRALLLTVPLERAGKANDERVVVTAKPGEALVHPVYSRDGKSIFYVWADETKSQLRQVKATGGGDRLLLELPCKILSPAVHPAGDRLVFVSDRNGVYNLYELELGPGARPRALTHVLGGVFSPDFSPDGENVAVAAYDSRGYYLAVLDYSKLGVEKALPALADDWKVRAEPDRLKKFDERPPPRKTATKNYNSLFEMGFDGWSPWVTASGDGVGAGLVCMFSDPTDFQQLYLLAGGETDYGLPLGSVVYQFSGFYPTLTLFADYGIETYTELLSDEEDLYYDYEEEVGVAGMALTVPWDRADHQVSFSLGASFADRAGIEDSAEDYAGATIRQTNTFEGAEASLWCRLAFVNATYYGRSHSLEDGRYISLVAAWSDEEWAGDLSRTRYRADWAEYIGLPWGRNHVLRLGGTYATGTGDETLQGLFGLGTDIMSITDIPGLDRNIGLRGYGSNYQVGDEVVMGSVAYRFPLISVYRNINTTAPLYLHRWFGEVFYEGGVATSDGDMIDDENEWISSAGLELNFSTTVLRMLSIAPGLGVVYAFDYEERDSFDDEEYEYEGDDSDDDDLSWGDGKLQVYLSLKAVVSF